MTVSASDNTLHTDAKDRYRNESDQLQAFHTKYTAGAGQLVAEVQEAHANCTNCCTCQVGQAGPVELNVQATKVNSTKSYVSMQLRYKSLNGKTNDAAARTTMFVQSWPGWHDPASAAAVCTSTSLFKTI